MNLYCLPHDARSSPSSFSSPPFVLLLSHLTSFQPLLYNAMPEETCLSLSASPALYYLFPRRNERSRAAFSHARLPYLLDTAIDGDFLHGEIRLHLRSASVCSTPHEGRLRPASIVQSASQSHPCPTRLKTKKLAVHLFSAAVTRRLRAGSVNWNSRLTTPLLCLLQYHYGRTQQHMVRFSCANS